MAKKNTVNVYVVVGNSGIGKSTVLRGLTGLKRGPKTVKITTTDDTKLDVYVPTISSLQEFEIPPEEIIEKTEELGVTIVLVALRYNEAMQHPNADAYIKAFKKASWNIVEVAVLTKDPKKQPNNWTNSAPIISVKGGAKQLIKAVKKLFQWK